MKIESIDVAETIKITTALIETEASPSLNLKKALDNKITKDGTYTTKHDGVARQMFYSASGQHRYSEQGYSKLFGKHGSFKEYEQATKLSYLGVSTDAIADVLVKDPGTIATWQRPISKKANVFHEDLCLTITMRAMLLFIPHSAHHI